MKRLTEERILTHPNVRLNFAAPDHNDEGNLATLDQVNTAQVVDNAITEDDFSADNTEALAAGVEEVINTITVTAGATYTALWASMDYNLSSGNIRFRIRKDNLSGTIVKQTVAIPITGLNTMSFMGKDSTPSTTQVYVLTADSSAGSTVTGTLLGINPKK